MSSNISTDFIAPAGPITSPASTIALRLRRATGYARRTFGLGVLAVLAVTAPLEAAAPPSVANYQQTFRFPSTGNQGGYLFDSVIEGTDGRLYGTTVGGGADDGGLIFAINKDGSGHVVLHEFRISLADGFLPWGTVVEGSDGKLYGATREGGLLDAGTVYSINKNGSGFTILRDFAEDEGDGAFPMNTVIEGSDGRLYGRTLNGGGGGGSAIFGLNKNGSGYDVLHFFDVSLPDNIDSFSGLIEGRDGLLYGTTFSDGAHGRGSIFKIHRDGTGFATLHDFGDVPGDGAFPYGPLRETSEGALYGTTSDGGDFTWGIVYKLERDGTGYRSLYHFDPNSGEGYLPVAPPVEGPGGLLYGTTYFGGAADNGTIYLMHKDGTGLQFIYDFQEDGIDGIEPNAALLRGRDGALYGTSYKGSGTLLGSIFRIRPVGLVGESTPGGFTLRLEGFATHRYAIETTDTLPPAWIEVGTVNNLTGVVRWPDPAPHPAHRFYRARVLDP